MRQTPLSRRPRTRVPSTMLHGTSRSRKRMNGVSQALYEMLLLISIIGTHVVATSTLQRARWDCVGKSHLGFVVLRSTARCGSRTTRLRERRTRTHIFTSPRAQLRRSQADSRAQEAGGGARAPSRRLSVTTLECGRQKRYTHVHRAPVRGPQRSDNQRLSRQQQMVMLVQLTCVTP